MDKYHIRRAILDALLDLDPAPAGIDDLAGFPRIEMAGIVRAELMCELRGLIAHGYVEDLRPGRAPLARITARGRDQIGREAAPEEYVWGRVAGEFTGGGG